MPNVQKLKATERLEAIDKEMKDLTSEQETRLETLEGLDPKADGTAEQRTTILAKVKDVNREIKKLRDERSQLEAEVEAADLVDQEHREGIRRRSPEKPRASQEEKAARSFSWHRFIECSLSDNWDGAEKDVRQMGLDEARALGRTVEGNPIPSSLIAVMGEDNEGNRVNVNDITKRDQSVGTNSEGGFMVETTLGNLIPALTPRTRVLGMGVQFLPGLEGNLAWPRETNVITGASVAEKTAAAESSIVLDQVTMAPKRIAHFTEFTRKLMHQGKQAINVIVPNRLDRGLGIEWDRQLINGSGASEELIGLLNISGIGDVAVGTNGGPLTWSLILQLEEAIADANADVGDIRFLTNPKVRRAMKEIEKAANTARFLMDDDGMTSNSYPVEVTTQVPSNLTKGTSSGVCSALIQGYWPGMMVGHWGTDIIANEFSLDKEAMIRVSAHLWTDMDVEHPEMFAAIQDVTTA